MGPISKRALKLVGLFAASALLLGAAVLFAPRIERYLDSHEANAVKPRAQIQIFLVDDVSDPFDKRGRDAPAGVSVLRTYVPSRSSDPPMVRRSFVHLLPQGGEGLPQAHERIAPWIALAPGRRVAWGEWDDETITAIDRDDEIVKNGGGFVSYLLDGEPIVTTVDVAGVYLGQDEEGASFVGLRLGPPAAERFRVFNERHLKERLALLVNGVVRFAPVLNRAAEVGLLRLYVGDGEPEAVQLRASRLYRQLQEP